MLFLSKIILTIILYLCLYCLKAQTVFYVDAGLGVSYSDLTYSFNDGTGNKNISGFVGGFKTGASISSFRSENFGLGVDFYLNNIPYHNLINSKDTRYLSYKTRISIFNRLDLNQTLSVKPQLSFNKYFNNPFRGKMRSFEFGIGFIYKKKNLSYEVLFTSFPEFDDLIEYGNTSSYYKIKSKHYPFVGFSVGYLLNDFDKLIININEKEETYFNTHRGFRVEAGAMLILPGIGLSYQFSDTLGQKWVEEFGIRGGHYEYASGINIYYSRKYKLIQRNHYKFQPGFEVGGSMFFWDRTTPLPHLLVVVDNEFTRWFIRVGGGIGLLGTIGYKIF